MREVSERQVIRRLSAENPWWREEEVPSPYADWRPRPYLDLLYPLVESREVRRAVVLMGPRRVGKTVLLHHAISRLLEAGVEPTRVLYVSVDHPLYNGLGLEDFLELYGQAAAVDVRRDPTWVFFDEIQYLRGWEIHLKALVDRWPAVRVTVSGSAAAALRLKSLESGAGRFTEFLLPPLTFYEFLRLRERDGLVEFDGGDAVPSSPDVEALNRELLDYLAYGGYPEALFTPAIRDDAQRFIKSDIIDKVLLRDLPGLYGIQDVQELNHLFTTLAYNTAGEVSPEELSKSSGVAKNTIKRYLEYLEAAFLIRIVHRVDRAAKRFQRLRSFKVYLTNPSIRSALFAPLGAGDPAMGALVETAVFAQWLHRDERLFYARWRDGEVDLVRLAPGRKVDWALEVKWSDRHADQPGELRSLLQFCRAHDLPRAWVTTRSVRATATVQGVELVLVPASLFCWSVGHREIETSPNPGGNALPL